MQFHHRIGAYLLLIAALATAMGALRSRYMPDGAKVLALALGVGVLIQAGLGIATLMTHVPIALGIAHQVMAALVLSLAVAFAWRVRRP